MNLLTWLDEPLTDRGIRVAAQNTQSAPSFSSYAELAAEITGTAAALLDRGLRRGDVVAILLGEPRAFVIGFYATIAAGGTACPIATPLTFRSPERYHQHLVRLLDTATPKFILADGSLREHAERAVAAAGQPATVVSFIADDLRAAGQVTPRPPADHVLLQFTSGSSGSPKGVRVSGENLDANLAALRSWLRLPADATAVSWLPLYHDMGLIGMMMLPVSTGLDLSLMTPAQFLRKPVRWLAELAGSARTYTMSPGFGYSYAARRVAPHEIAPLDLSRIHVAVLAAERIVPRSVAPFLTLAQPQGFTADRFSVAYGLAEATLGVTGTPVGTPVPLVRVQKWAIDDGEAMPINGRGTLGAGGLDDDYWIAGCGRAMAGVEVEIVDADGKTLPDGCRGQIRVYGDSVAQGYRTLRQESTTGFGPHGLDTGDSGFLLDGELYVIGRVGDSIKVRGVTVYAEDLETAVSALGEITQGRFAVVLGSSDGRDTAAVIVETDGEPPSQRWLTGVRSIVAATMSDALTVAVFRGNRGTIERTSSGKPRRRALWHRVISNDPALEPVPLDRPAIDLSLEAR